MKASDPRAATIDLRRPLASLLFAVLPLAVLPAVALAQTWKVAADDDWCDDRGWGSRHCEVREITLPAGRDVVEVDGGKNGGIRVEGWDRNEIRIRVKIEVWDLEGEAAAEYASRIEIATDGAIEARGPRRDGDGNWSASFRLQVPRRSDLALATHNGGISIENVSGAIDFRAKNGGVRLVGLGGEVRGYTKNGGLSVVLAGGVWDGEGLDVETKNGGIELEVPEKYSGRLLMRTVNGRVRADLPVTLKGGHEKWIRAVLGDGGPLIRLTTTNGGVSVRES